MGPIGCAETSVIIYHYSPRNSPEERSSHLFSCVRLKSLIFLTLLYKYGSYKKSSYNIYKRGDIDLESVMAQWAIYCVISQLCGVQRDRSLW